MGMRVIPTVVIPLNGKGGGFWIFIGLLILALALMFGDPDYKSASESEREVSLKYRQSESKKLAPNPPMDHRSHPLYPGPHWRPVVPVYPIYMSLTGTGGYVPPPRSETTH